MQAALVNAYARWPSVRREDAFAYVRRSIVNGHVSWWRRFSQREFLTDALPEAATPDSSLAVEVRDTLRMALQKLTPRERRVIVLRYIEDLSEQQTATELGIPVGTVKSTAARGLQKLRAAAITEHAGDGP